MFTNDISVRNKDAFRLRRLDDISLFLGCETHEWEAWILADEEGHSLMEVKKAFRPLQSWLFFGLIHETIHITRLMVDQNTFIDSSGRYLTTECLNKRLVEVYADVNAALTAQTARLNEFVMRILAQYRYPIAAIVIEFSQSPRLRTLNTTTWFQNFTTTNPMTGSSNFRSARRPFVSA